MILAAAVALAVGAAFGGNAHYQSARKSPVWLTKGVIYQIQPRAFTWWNTSTGT
jgi:hypothetical protein